MIEDDTKQGCTYLYHSAYAVGGPCVATVKNHVYWGCIYAHTQAGTLYGPQWMLRYIAAEYRPSDETVHLQYTVLCLIPLACDIRTSDNRVKVLVATQVGVSWALRSSGSGIQVLRNGVIGHPSDMPTIFPKESLI